MKRCPYCGFPNYPNAIECQKCQGAFVSQLGTLYSSTRSCLVGPEKAHHVRSDALAAIALGLLIKVYGGGYGPWPVIDSPTLVSLRAFLEPLLLHGGVVAYFVGFFLRWM